MSEQRILQPTSEQIARAAYLMWEQEGRPHGRDLQHWLQAESQLMAGTFRDGKSVRRAPSAPAPAAKRAQSAHRMKAERSEPLGL
jgi:hypothetical protein